ncbi:MAG: Bax inhibitor-1/YccA family protein [Rhodospirillaceae bacterium]|nr:Bax inhibitor-1/YccA family protein [Rhodospirillaceae bacterium]MYF85454.1 Bax inhibitor-1/YccA family protein [Rhodospirillaceae bacterium]MYH39384.1 Bax inhibitor-1/YccA family protein [Rhodospirillaceae bacterium]MYK13907.1 Bax inhibitor-1/YccA family protein [Rhodospirillaceae bacterium]MYK59667.1 Bax inhibitor-1/YccA family protein [Rhodospirillaceae bacterium]
MDPRHQGGFASGAATAAAFDEGLRAYMLKVYNYMVVGLVLTGAVAFAVINVPAISSLFFATVQTSYGLATQLTILGWIALFAPLLFVWVFASRLHSMDPNTAQTLFWVYAGLMGLALAPIVAVYTSMSIAKVFFMTAATFGAMSLYGYTTKRDLTRWGSFLMMGLIGIIIAMVVNIFLASPALHFAISVIGVLVFVGLTAYDTQRIKSMYAAADGTAVMTRKAIMGALQLYLDFVNLFLMLLMLFGNRE